MYRYNQLINECFNIHDDLTLELLTTVNEAGKNTILDSLASKLYESIMDRVADIDFGSVPDSKGDITQIQNYDKMLECIDTIDKILSEYNQDKTILEIVKRAIDNTIARKDLFSKGFALNVHLPIVIYNTIVTSIVSSVSLIISAAIGFIGDAGNTGFAVKFDSASYNKSKDNVLFKNLASYNVACDSGDLDKAIDYSMQIAKKNLMGVDTGLIVGAMAIVGLSLNIIPLTRELIFFFYNTKQSFSDYCELQSELIRINSEYVKNNTISNKTDKERKEIARKQAKIADQFNKLAIATRVDCQKASDKAKIETKASDRKYRVDEIMDKKTIETIQNNDTNVESIF